MMDIPKYIGLFLIKYEFCYLPGIGNLEIKRKAAGYNSLTKELESPKYELHYTQSIGSIDDSFANFIANNERISIAHAANAIRDFSTHARRTLAEGQALEIPGIGKFLSTNNIIRFEQDSNLHLEGKAIPFFKTSTRVEETKPTPISEIYQQTSFREPKGDEEIILQAPKVNWGKITLIGLLGALLLGGAIFLFWYFSNNTEGVKNEANTEQAKTTEEPAGTTTPADTVTTQPTTAPVTTGSSIVLNTYPDSVRAAKRTSKLQSFGHNVQMIQKDTAWLVVFPVVTPVTDQQVTLDSVRRVFGGEVKWMQ